MVINWLTPTRYYVSRLVSSRLLSHTLPTPPPPLYLEFRFSVARITSFDMFRLLQRTAFAESADPGQRKEGEEKIIANIFIFLQNMIFENILVIKLKISIL